MRRGGGRGELRGECGHGGGCGGGCDLAATTQKEKKKSLVRKRDHDYDS